MTLSERFRGSYFGRSFTGVLALFALTISTFARGAEPEVHLTLEKSVIVNDGAFTASIRITNSSDDPLSVTGPTNPAGAIRMTVDGNQIQTSAAGPSGDRERSLDPRQFLGHTFRVAPEKTAWDQPREIQLSWEYQDLTSNTVTAYYFPDRTAQIELQKFGPVFIDFFYESAPRNIYHFMTRIQNGFYDGLTFHRLIPNYILQGGDPEGDGTGGGKSKVPPEFNDHPHKFGTVSMAHGHRSNKSGSQFFITLGRQPVLDGKYTVIGRVRDEASKSLLRQLQKEVKTDHKDSEVCGVDHLDKPKEPPVMKSVSLLTEEQYQQASANRSRPSEAGAKKTSEQAPDSNTSRDPSNPLKNTGTPSDSPSNEDK